MVFARGSWLLFLTCLVGFAALGTPPTTWPLREARLVWLFSWDGRFVAVDLDAERLVDAGNLWYMDIRDVDGVIPWPTDEYLFLLTKTWKLQGLANPSPEQWETRGLAVLTRSSEGGLLFQRLIAPPEGATLVGVRALTIAGQTRLFLGWRSIDNGKDFATSYDSGLNEVSHLDGYRVSPYSCSVPGGLLTPQLGYPRLKFIWDFSHSSFSQQSYDEIDGWGFASATPLSVSSDCTAVIAARTGPPSSSDRTLILYDLSKDVRISQFPVQSGTVPHYLPKRSLILLENYEPDAPGETTTRRSRTTGQIDFLSKDGTRLGSLDVPKAGSLIAFSPDETLGFHLSPWILSVIDLQARKIRFQVDVPFTDAKIGWFGSISKEK